MQSKKQPEINGLVGAVYAAALDATRWPAVLESVSAVVGAAAGSMWLHDFSDSSADFDTHSGNVAAFMGLSDSSLVSYASHYSNVNVWTAAEQDLSAGSVVTGSMLYPDSLLKRTEFYNDWLKPQDLFHTLGSVVVKEQSRAVKLSFLRAERSGAYSTDELHVLRQLMPHLQTAMAVHRKMHRLEALAASAVAALDAVPYGVILLSGTGNVMHLNKAARRTAERTRALEFGAGGLVRAATSAGTAKLHRLIQDAARTGAGQGVAAGGVLRLPGAHGLHLQVLVAPMPLHAKPFGQGVAAAVFFSDPGAALCGLAQSLQAIKQ